MKILQSKFNICEVLALVRMEILQMVIFVHNKMYLNDLMIGDG